MKSTNDPNCPHPVWKARVRDDDGRVVYVSASSKGRALAEQEAYGMRVHWKALDLDSEE